MYFHFAVGGTGNAVPVLIILGLGRKVDVRVCLVFCSRFQ